MNIDIYHPPKRYKTLYIDPAWEERGGGRGMLEAHRTIFGGKEG